jgi:deoxyribonuclease-4
VSAAQGLSRALPRAEAIGAETFQVFVSSARAWRPPTPDPADDAAFAQANRVPVFVHSPYLINLASPSPETVAKSRAALEFALRRSAAIGAAGVVMHAGSAVAGHSHDAAMEQLRSRLLSVLDDVGDGPPLLVEPTAGGGGALASSAESLADYLDAFGRDERIGVCLDTCHMHASGHDMSTEAGFAAAVTAFAAASGRGVIRLVHVNDSRDPVGSKRDRHAPLGGGTIGHDAFRALFTAPALRGVPLIVETPEAGHASDVATLKSLRGAV